MLRFVLLFVTILSYLSGRSDGQLQQDNVTPTVFSSSHKTATFRDSSTVSAAFIQNNDELYPCNGMYLQFVVCSQKSSCNILNTCPFLGTNAIPGYPAIYDIAVSGTTVYTVTTANHYSIVKCEISGTTLTSCAIKPLLNVTRILNAQIVVTPTANAPTQIHVIYDIYSQDDKAYVAATVCDTNLIRCSFHNISSIANYQTQGKTAALPSSVIIGSNVHIAINSGDPDYGAILTCNWNGYTSCNFYKFLYDDPPYYKPARSYGLISSIASVYTGGVYYLFYSVNYGYHTDLTLRTCSITGSSVLCSYRYSLYFGLNIITYGTPSITPVPYLGSVIAAVQLIGRYGNQVLITNYKLGSQVTSTTTNITLQDSLQTIELPRNDQTRVTTCLTSVSSTGSSSTHTYYVTYINLFPGVANPPMPPPSPPPPAPPPRPPPFRPPPGPSRRPPPKTPPPRHPPLKSPPTLRQSPPKTPPPGTRPPPTRTPPPPKSKPSPPPLPFKRPPPQKQPPRPLLPPPSPPKRLPQKQPPPPRRPPPRKQPPPSNKPPPLSPPKRPPPQKPPPLRRPPPLKPPPKPTPKPTLMPTPKPTPKPTLTPSTNYATLGPLIYQADPYPGGPTPMSWADPGKPSDMTFASTDLYGFVAPFNGSIIGISGTAGTYDGCDELCSFVVSVRINGTEFIPPQKNFPMQTVEQPGKGNITFDAGSFKFCRGDVISVYFGASRATAILASALLTIAWDRTVLGPAAYNTDYPGGPVKMMWQENGYVAPFSGSVVAVSGAAGAGVDVCEPCAFVVSVRINNIDIVPATNNFPLATFGKPGLGHVVFASGMYTFNKGDVLSVYFGASRAVPIRSTAWLFVVPSTANTAGRKLQKHIRGYARRRLHSNATAIYDVNNMHELTSGNTTN